MSREMAIIRDSGENFRHVIQRKYDTNKRVSGEQYALQEYEKSTDEFAAWAIELDNKLRDFISQRNGDASNAVKNLTGPTSQTAGRVDNRTKGGDGI